MTGKQSCHRRFLMRCQHLKNCLGFVSVALINVFLSLRIWTCRTHTAYKQTSALSWDQLCRFLERVGKVVFIFFSPQIIPAGNMPTYGKKYQNNSRLVICNLQPTKQAKLSSLSLNTLCHSPYVLTPRTRRQTCASTPTLTT